MESEDLSYSPNELHLKSLKKYLNYQIPTFFLFPLYFFSPILITFLGVAAILFIPYAIFALYKNDKYIWIFTLLLITVIPCVILIIFLDNFHALFLFLIVDLAIFYFYCFSLRFAVNGWVREIEFVKLNNYEYRKFKKQQRYDNFSR